MQKCLMDQLESRDNMVNILFVLDKKYLYISGEFSGFILEVQCLHCISIQRQYHMKARGSHKKYRKHTSASGFK